MATVSSIIASPMHLDEAGSVANLMRRVIEPLHYYNDRARLEELAKYSQSALERLVEEEPLSVLVAREDKEIVGFCVSKYDDGLVWLSWFGTDTSRREKGVGTSLLHALGDTLPKRQAHKIWCDTRTDNLESQADLVRFGIRRIVELRNHWYGQDFFLWEWYPQ
jgi:ribosomal protein S18 acetylase RimI-like enzyme